jgi:hypothetical protein
MALYPVHYGRLRIINHFTFRNAPLDTNSAFLVQIALLSLLLPDLAVIPNKFESS